jgi:hypothetical protein
VSKNNPSLTTSIISIVILIGVCVWWFSATPTSSSTYDQNSSSTTGDVHGAWAYMQLFVEKKLKSPRSADFPFGGSRHVTPLGGGRYRVNSYVDSENSFGAEMRTNFHGVISRTSNGWKLESLEFN